MAQQVGLASAPVSIRSDRYTRISQTRGVIYTRHLFLTVLEAGQVPEQGTSRFDVW